jgi:hypothetical protein
MGSVGTVRRVALAGAGSAVTQARASRRVALVGAELETQTRTFRRAVSVGAGSAATQARASRLVASTAAPELAVERGEGYSLETSKADSGWLSEFITGLFA